MPNFFKLIKKGLYVNPGKRKLEKPETYVGNTVYMIDKILQSNVSHGQVYYLADYPEYSIQEWPNSITNYLDKNLPITIPKFLANGLAKLGDILKLTHVYSDPPLSTIRLKNILSSAKYDLNKTKSVVDRLPYGLNNGVRLTVDWMNDHLNYQKGV